MSDIESNKDVTDINILLLGEKSSGKSTFINSFGNYLRSPSLDRAVKSDLIFLIPTEFTTTDEHFNECVVRLCESNDQDIVVSTQESKCYVFPIRGEDMMINLIDTPGIGDGRNAEQDLVNFDNILSYVSQFDHLNAICFFLNPSIGELSDYYKFCFTNLLRRLGPTASKKVVFIINKSRSSFYKPEGSIAILKPFLKSIQDDFQVECSKENIFCMDNEGFRYLAALKNGHSFGEMEQNIFGVSWEVSVKAVKNLLAFSKINEESDFISVTKHRRLSMHLLKPLSDVVDLIKLNIVGLIRHKNLILSKSNQADDVVDLLFVPEICYEISDVGGEIVCLSNTCKNEDNISQDSPTTKKLCQSECTLNIISGSLIGCPELLVADVFSGSKECSTCGCDISTHVYNAYNIEKYLSKITKESPEQSNTELKKIFDLIEKIDKRQTKYQKELKKVLKLLCNIFVFLSSSQIVKEKNAFLELLQHHVKCEMDSEKEDESCKFYQNILIQYQEELARLSENPTVDPKDSIKTMINIFQFENIGSTARRLYDSYMDVAQSKFTDSMKYCFELDFFPENVETSEDESATENEEQSDTESEEQSEIDDDRTDYDNLSEMNDDNCSVTTNEVEDETEEIINLTKAMSQQSLASSTCDDVKLNNVNYKQNDFKKDVNKSVDEIKQQNVKNRRRNFRRSNYNRRTTNRQQHNPQNQGHVPPPLMQQYQTPCFQPNQNHPVNFPPNQGTHNYQFPQRNQFYQNAPPLYQINPNSFSKISNSPSVLNDAVLMDALKKNVQHGVNLQSRGGIFNRRGRGNHNSNRGGGGNRERNKANPSSRDSSCSRNSRKNDFRENSGGRGKEGRGREGRGRNGRGRDGRGLGNKIVVKDSTLMSNISKQNVDFNTKSNKREPSQDKTNIQKQSKDRRNNRESQNKPPRKNYKKCDSRVTCALQNSNLNENTNQTKSDKLTRPNQNVSKPQSSNPQKQSNTGAIKKIPSGTNQNVSRHPQNKPNTGAIKREPSRIKHVAKPSNQLKSHDIGSFLKPQSIVFNIQNNNGVKLPNKTTQDCTIS